VAWQAAATRPHHLKQLCCRACPLWTTVWWHNPIDWGLVHQGHINAISSFLSMQFRWFW
jgi:hypothetical protein